MIKANSIYKAITVFIIVELLLLNFPPIVSYADSNKRIVVSMGDSYSSGEGIPPFYGQEKELSERVNDQDWLAHRSEHAWAGQLCVSGIGMLNHCRYGDEDVIDPQWYFVAASGAETKHLYEFFPKPYSKGTLSAKDDDAPVLYPQLAIFGELDEEPDYVTLTLGGNDAGFKDILTTSAMESNYFCPTKLTDKFREVWDRFFIDDGIRKDLYDAYHDIYSATNEESCIIVVGYPQLLSNSGLPLIFDDFECEFINKNVSYFNKAISGVVEQCKKEGMNIHFVSVEEAFAGHGAYSLDPYINWIEITHDQDLIDFDVNDKDTWVSAYSFHPNEKGARAYAECVQAKIDELENDSELSSAEEDTIIKDGVLTGSWSPNIFGTEPEVIEFYYSQDKNAVERLMYTHYHSFNETSYEYSTGYVSDPLNKSICSCVPWNKTEYTYISFDISHIKDGVIYDQITNTPFYKISDRNLIEPSDLNQNIPFNFDSCWPEIEESMNEWFGNDYILMSEGDRIWGHGIDKNYYDYINGTYSGDAVYDDYYKSGARQSAEFLYSYAKKSNIDNPRVIFLVSGQMYGKESTIYVFVNGELIYDYERDSDKLVSWG